MKKTFLVPRQNELAPWVMDVVEQGNLNSQLSPEQNLEVRRRMANREEPVSVEKAATFFQKYN